MSLDSLQDVLHEQLRDLLSAEKQLTKALPKMAKAASSEELREAIEDHLQVTEGHVQRLVQIFDKLGEPPKAKTCKAMQGLIEEGGEVIKEKRESEPSAIDAALIAAAQRVEHYEISAYGSARAFAEALGHMDIANLLQQTLDEESQADEILGNVAKSVNTDALSAADDSDSDADESASLPERTNGATQRRAASRSVGMAATGRRRAPR